MALAKLAEEIQEVVWERQAMREEELNYYKSTHPTINSSQAKNKQIEKSDLLH